MTKQKDIVVTIGNCVIIDYQYKQELF